MNCQDIRHLLPGYWESEPHQQATMQAHLTHCPACRDEFECYELIRGDLAAATHIQPVVYEQVASQVHARIGASRRRPWYWAAAAAAILMAASLTVRDPDVAEMRVELKYPTAPDLDPGFRRPVPAKPRRVRKPVVAEPMEIRIVGDDPSVLIVWQVGDLPSGGGDE